MTGMGAGEFVIHMEHGLRLRGWLLMVKPTKTLLHWKACQFLLSKQLPDGGWGESYHSSSNKVKSHGNYVEKLSKREGKKKKMKSLFLNNLLHLFFIILLSIIFNCLLCPSMSSGTFGTFRILLLNITNVVEN